MYRTFKPKSKNLRKYIREFTVLDEKSKFPLEYFAFPHSVSAILFLQNSKIEYNSKILEVDRKPTNNPIVISIGKYIEPLFVSYKQHVNEIAINFTQTGINYFFDESFSEIAKFPAQEIKDAEMITFSKKMFDIRKEDRIESLELFLEQRFRKKDLKIVEQVINILENDKSLKFKTICKALKVSERNVNRLFHKYIGCSPKDYKKIIRFRGAIKDYTKNESNLTTISLENEYYDSPHFSRELKKLTNKKPSDYFKQLTLISKEKYPYIFK